MRIGILEAGNLHPRLVTRFGDYTQRYAAMFHAVDPSVDVKGWRFHDGERPNPKDADAWLIGGSKHGVYDPEPFIEPLKAFIRDAVAAARPMAGVCFGHQILAEALGGRAEKADIGWCLGVRPGSAIKAPDWLGPLHAGYKLHSVHQDQVTALPKDATVLAESPNCPIAAVAYGDLTAPYAVSVQGHPEFCADFMADLIDVRLRHVIEPALVQKATETLGDSVDNAAWANALLSALSKGGQA